MVKATYEIRIDWDDDDVFGAGSEDVTSRVIREIEWQLGTRREQIGRSLLRAQARLILNNESGDYSPFNTSSPLAGNLKVGRKVRIRATDATGTETMWTGEIESIVPEPDLNRPNICIITCVSPFTALEDRKVQMSTKTAVLTGTLGGNLLDSVSWPAGDRDLDAGQTTITRYAAADFQENELDLSAALREVALTENGLVYENRLRQFVFEDRDHRLKSPHTTSQATFTDASGGALSYSWIKHEELEESVCNIVPIIIQLYTTGALAVLWTFPAITASTAPAIAPGETLEVWASYPNPSSPINAFQVDDWNDGAANPVATTDYTFNDTAGGGGNDRTASVAAVGTKFATSQKIVFTNNHATDTVYPDKIEIRGTPVTKDDPIKLQVEDQTSKDDYQERTCANTGKFVPTVQEGYDHINWRLAIQKDPAPIVSLTVQANRDAATLSQVLRRTISDRLTIVGTNDAGIGINEDVFIESEHHIVDSDLNHQVTWETSPVSGLTNFWTLSVGELGITTALHYGDA